MIDKRNNRITDLYKMALKLAQDEDNTAESIRHMLMIKAQTVVSASTAKQYVDEVFNRIDRVRELQLKNE